MDATELDIAENFTALKRHGINNATRKTPYNPLINAANCFFVATKNPNLNKLKVTQKQLLNNLESFERIVSHYYTEAFELISIYLLCFTLDTLISYRLGRYHEQWHPYYLVNEVFQYNNAESVSRFLDAIDYLYISDEVDTRLLEFAYLCMSLAVQNNSKIDVMQRQRAEVAIGKLYKKIYDNRGGFQTELEIKPPKTSTAPSQGQYFPAWLILLLTIITLMTVFSVTTFLFNFSAKHTFKSLIATHTTTVIHEKSS